jgi:hypothetical protein
VALDALVDGLIASLLRRRIRAAASSVRVLEAEPTRDLRNLQFASSPRTSSTALPVAGMPWGPSRQLPLCRPGIRHRASARRPKLGIHLHTWRPSSTSRIRTVKTEWRPIGLD